MCKGGQSCYYDFDMVARELVFEIELGIPPTENQS